MFARSLTESSIHGCRRDRTECNSDSVAVVLQKEFGVQPSDVEVAEGDVAVLNCVPPKGRPEPNVTWMRDGLLINSSDDHFTVSPLLRHEWDDAFMRRVAL